MQNGLIFRIVDVFVSKFAINGFISSCPDFIFYFEKNEKILLELIFNNFLLIFNLLIIIILINL